MQSFIFSLQVMSRLAELSPKEVEALEQEFESAGWV